MLAIGAHRNKNDIKLFLGKLQMHRHSFCLKILGSFSVFSSEDESGPKESENRPS